MDLGFIIGGVILVLCILFTVIFLKRKSITLGKESAMDFLNGLYVVIYDTIVETIAKLVKSDSNSFEEFQNEALKNIYDNVWNYVSNEVNDLVERKHLGPVAAKIINKEFVDAFVNTIIEKSDVKNKIEQKWSEDYDETVLKEDKDLQEKFSDDEQYVENSDVSDLEPAEDASTYIENYDEKEANLNPPKDEIDEYDPETDSSVEEIINEEDLYFYDKNGRRRNKSNGRFA